MEVRLKSYNVREFPFKVPDFGHSGALESSKATEASPCSSGPEAGTSTSTGRPLPIAEDSGAIYRCARASQGMRGHTAFLTFATKPHPEAV